MPAIIMWLLGVPVIVIILLYLIFSGGLETVDHRVLHNVITVDRLDDRTTILFVNGGMEILETAADDVIWPYQVSGHAPLI